MVKRLDSQALGDVNRALGLTGSGSPITELTDGVVDQVLAINEVARRGRVFADTSGLFYPTLRNVHTDAETLTTTINPYEPGTVAAVPPYPAVVPPGFDFWIFGAGIRRVSGGGTLLATLSIDVGTRNAGFGVDDSGTQILASEPIRLAYWTALATVGTVFAVRQSGRGPFASIGIRVPRNVATIQFASVSSLTSSYDCQLICGLFPAALGQDGLV